MGNNRFGFDIYELKKGDVVKIVRKDSAQIGYYIKVDYNIFWGFTKLENCYVALEIGIQGFYSSSTEEVSYYIYSAKNAEVIHA